MAYDDELTLHAEVACPDPHCGARFGTRRTGTTTFCHGDVPRVPLGGGEAAPEKAER